MENTGNTNGMQTALLNWALSNSGPRPDGSTEAPPVQIDRKWMDVLLKSVVDKMRDALKRFQDEKSTLEERLDALEELNEHCERIDAANDLSKIGGLKVLLEATKDPSAEIRSNVAFVIGTCAQNNPEFQNVLAEQGGIEALLHLLAATETPQVRGKALFALSGAMRNNLNNCNMCMRLNGFESMTRSLHGTDLAFRRKLTFILNNFVMEVPAIAELLIQKAEVDAILEQLTSDDTDLLFNTLTLLGTLTRSSPRNAKHYKDNGALEKIRAMLARTRSQTDLNEINAKAAGLIGVLSK